MNDEQLIKALIKKDEDIQLEFKALFNIKTAAQVICGFLNAEGGTLIIGVEDKGKIIGVEDALQKGEELRKYILNSIIPEAPVTITTEKVGRKEVLMANVWNGSKPPYVYSGNIYYRRGSSTLKATSADISRMIEERQKNELHWERQTALGVELEDLDETEIKKTIKDSEDSGRDRAFKENATEEFLSYYGLYRNGNLTNAAVVLFGQNPSYYLPQSRIRLTVFKGSKTSDIIHDKFFNGNLFVNFNNVIEFFDVNIASSSSFKDKSWLREDNPFPRKALREGLLNALVHRDYSSPSGSVHISFYSDRLEIVNTGELAGGYKPSDLGKNHLSVPRNPDIAQICFIRKMMDKIGKGTIVIIEDCEKKKYPKPHWESKTGYTTLTFPKITIAGKSNDAINDVVNGEVNDIVNGGVNDIVNGNVFSAFVSVAGFPFGNIIGTLLDTAARATLVAVNQSVKKGLVNVAKVIFKNRNNATINEIIKAVKKSPRTVQRYLQILKSAEIIEFIGPPKTGTYRLTRKALKKINQLNERIGNKG